MSSVSPENKHWSEIAEVGGSPWHFRFMLWMVTHLPLVLVEICTAVICFFFWIGAGPVRKRSYDFLRRCAAAQNKKPDFMGTYKHIYSFALSMLEKMLGWKGRVKLNRIEKMNDDLDLLAENLNEGKGAFMICSHLGNMEMLRSLTGFGEIHAKKDFKVYPVVDFSGTQKFNALLRELNPELMDIVVDANKIGVDTAVWMKEKIDEGNLVVIAGDRTSAHTRDRVLETQFMGENAYFPEGAFSLAGILGAPVYFAFALRKKDFNIRASYEMHVIKARTSLDCSRKERPARLKMLLQEYTEILERLCKVHPYQWYNFYNFWERSSVNERNAS